MLIGETDEACQVQELGLLVNGTHHALRVTPDVTLLDLLREQLRLTGTRKGCDHGQCGCCTVLVDGRRANACLQLAVANDGAAITTIEGLADSQGQLSPLQQAFIDHDAFQCGFCTSGQIMSATALLSEGAAHGRAEISEMMSGNLCRCGAYSNIVDAIEAVMAERGP